MSQSLPESYLNRMEAMLGEEFPAYLRCFSEEKHAGLRVNTNRISTAEFEKIAPFPLKRVPWTDDGYYIPGDVRAAKHPYYFAGLYYLQEPSAMLPAEILKVKPNERVLDLCAAPGGKSTKLLCSMQNTGVLVSNDISFSRAQALLKNLELFGASHAIVTAESPEKLSSAFPAYFDKILIDAPCSGEGMFRKDPAVIRSWVEHGNAFYVSLQRSILKAAVSMLKPGGSLLYSTCTFAPEEDEEAVLFAMELCPSLRIQAPEMNIEGAAEGIAAPYGRPELKKCIRMYPHRVRGEGHFVALLKKEAYTAEAPEETLPRVRRSASDAIIVRFSDLSPETQEFLRPMEKALKNGVFERYGERVSFLPDGFPDTAGLRLVRKGLFLGEEKNKRFEPSEAFAMSLEASSFPNRLLLSSGDERVLKYLKGETIELNDEYLPDGYVLVTIEGHPLGFAKNRSGVLKNRYLPGWRYT